MPAATTINPAWVLFADWCTSAEAVPLPATPELIQAFLDELPAGRTTRYARLRAIRDRHALLGLADPWPPEANHMADTVLDDLLPTFTVRGWPEGVSGRRDAYLLVLVRGLELTRRQIRNLPAADLDHGIDGLAVRGDLVTETGDPGTCALCALTRWLRLLNLSELHGWDAVRRAMIGHWTARADQEEEHDCQRSLGGAWKRAEVLLPRVDPHGWVEGATPLSVRSISAVINRRQQSNIDRMPDSHGEAHTSMPAAPSADRVPWSRQNTAGALAELDPLLDRLDFEIDAALKRVKEILP